MANDVRKHHGETHPVGTERNEPHPRYTANDYFTGYQGEFLMGLDALSRTMEGLFPDWDAEDEDSYCLETHPRAAYVFEIIGTDGKNKHEIPLPTFLLTNDEGRQLFGYVLSNPVHLVHVEKGERELKANGEEKGCEHCLYPMIPPDFWDAYGMTLLKELPDINDDDAGWTVAHTKRNYSMGKLKSWQWRHDFWSDTIPLEARARGGRAGTDKQAERNQKLVWHGEMKGKCRRWLIWDALERDRTLKNSNLVEILADAVGKTYTLDAIKKIKRRINEVPAWSESEKEEVFRYARKRGWIKGDSAPDIGISEAEPKADHHDSAEEDFSFSIDSVSRGEDESRKSVDMAGILQALDEYEPC